MTDASAAALEAARAARSNGSAKKAVINPILRQQANNSRKNAIIAMCAHCVGCTATSVEDGFRAMIRDCRCFSCPLHSWRPYQKKDDDSDEGGDDA